MSKPEVTWPDAREEYVQPHRKPRPRFRECFYGCPDSEWVNTDGAPIDAISFCPHPEHWRQS